MNGQQWAPMCAGFAVAVVLFLVLGYSDCGGDSDRIDHARPAVLPPETILLP